MLALYAAATPPTQLIDLQVSLASQSGSEPRPSRRGNSLGTMPRRDQLHSQGFIRLQARKTRPECHPHPMPPPTQEPTRPSLRSRANPAQRRRDTA